MIGVVRGNRLDQAEDDEAEYELHDTNSLFSTGVNLIPAPNAVQGTRHLYGNKFFEQAVPLQNRESPLVKSLNNETGRSWDWEIGKHLGIVRADEADEGALVESVTPDELRLRRADGSVVVRDLYDKFPANRNSLTQSYAKVKVGDMVHKGQTLAPSNFTDDEGRMALGLNARIALVPFKGHSMDDAVVISAGFAERLRSLHATTVDREHDDLLKGGKSHFTGLFHKTYTQEQLDKLDDAGLPVPGQLFQPGDPLVLQSRPRTFSSNKVDMSRLSKAQRFVRKDASLKWEGLHPATVIEVAKTKGKGHKILLEYTAGVEPGDKLTLRPGQKSYHPDTEVLTDQRGWVRIQDLINSDKVASLFDRNEVTVSTGRRARPVQDFVARFVKPLHANTYVFDGELYGLDAIRAAYLTTGNHRIWRAGHMGATPRWYCQDAAEVDGTPQKFMTAAEFDLSEREDPEFFDVAPVTHGVTGLPMDCETRFPFKAWVKFMAIYLAEGNVHHSTPKNHAIIITQKERAFCREFERVFDTMGLAWKRSRGQYLLGPNKALRRYLDQFGKAAQKHVPEEIKRASLSSLRLFISMIWQGDGDKDRGKEYYTSSPRLAEDVREILILMGHAVSVGEREQREHQNHSGFTVTKLDAGSTSTKKNYRDAFYREKYHGNVYCLQVPGLGVILTRFRGKVMWNGNSTVSKIIPDDKMPRTRDGLPLEMLMNPLSLPSRVNAETSLELMLGKIARKTGKAYVLPQFLPKGKGWNEFAREELEKHGLQDAEDIYDPEEDAFLEQPVATGEGFVMKLHHMAGKKMTARGQKGYCYDEETEVLTREGWKFWDTVTAEDQLYCPDVLTGTSVYAHPLELIRQEYEGDMLHYVSRYLDFKVTPEHRMWAGPRKDKKFLFAEITAENLSGKSRWSVPQYGYRLSEGGNADVRYLPCPTKKRCNKVYAKPLKVNFSDYALLLGWWLAEGTVQTSNKGYRTYIWQSEGANPSNWKEIRELLERITGKRPMEHKAKGLNVGLRSNDPRLGEFLQNYGDRCENKRVPEDLIFAGREAVELFLGAYCRGDGNLKEGAEVFDASDRGLIAHSASRMMLEDIQRMLIHAGMGAQVQLAKPKGTPYKFGDQRAGVTLLDSWAIHLHLRRPNAFIAGKKVSKRDPRYKGGWSRVFYKGRIYCARSVTGWLVVRRKGKVLVSGNSLDLQPMRGKGQAAQRVSGLEMAVLHSSGGRGVQKESVLLRGEMRDEYWKKLRANRNPGTLEAPFVWEKLKHLLQGAGVNPRDMGGGKLRLTPMTNAELQTRDPVEIQNEGIIDLKDFEPKPGGLFDPMMVREGRWGFIKLKRPTVNPAYEDTVRTLLGLTKEEYEKILDDEEEFDGRVEG